MSKKPHAADCLCKVCIGVKATAGQLVHLLGDDLGQRTDYLLAHYRWQTVMWMRRHRVRRWA